MTLPLYSQTAPWDRTLPKPLALVSNSSTEGYTRRGTSLLQHHLVGNHVLDVNQDYSADNGRRSTIACIPATRHPATGNVTAYDGAPQIDPHEHLIRKRPSSVMSAEDTSRSSSPTSTGAVEGSNQLCLCQKEPKIPRPRNAFILYRQHHHNSVVAQNPGLPNPEISKIIGEQWQTLPDQEKLEWKALAEDEKARHSQQYPGYRYKPRRSGRLGGQPSISEPSSLNESVAPCQKCGRRLPMNAPHTPYTPNTTAASSMPQMNARALATQQLVSPPHSARMRQYPTDVYGRPLPPPHDPRFQYASVQQRPVTVMEGPESKKRRFNGDAVYSTTRPIYADQTYQISPRERTISETMVTGQFHRPNMGPPARTGYPVQMQPARPSHPQIHRRDPSLTLPPLKTPLSQQVPASLSIGAQSQKSGIEAMIMSIPVLNKIKILSQIAPSLAVPGPGSPPREVRGAIIAVEGMDSNSVFNMTHTLAEQLEREGKFEVRIFGGPDPYAVLASSNRAGGGGGASGNEHLSFPGFLGLISQWHKISEEMQDYITRKPRVDGETPNDAIMSDAMTTSGQTPFSSSVFVEDGNKTPKPRTPVSAISPTTMTQTADLSLKSPPPSTDNATQSPQTRASQPKPRIPASAIAQAQAKAQIEAQSPTSSQHHMTHSQNTSLTSRPSTTQPQPPAPTTNSTLPRRPTSVLHSNTSAPSSDNLIPIAIVPHYQLTTVDASSIAMPIKDAYSPHSHWQWLATIWRGCLGPDVTVIIQAGDVPEDESPSADPSTVAVGTSTNSRIGSHASFSKPQPHHGFTGNPVVQRQPPSNQILQQQQQPTQQQGHNPTTQQDVEVRLLDCRAVVVRAPSGNKRSTTTVGSMDSDGLTGEWWEKAKRRVGFEVEEFLRR